MPPQVAKVGDTVKLKIFYSGKGPIGMKLKKDKHEVPESDQVKLQEFDDYVTVTLKGESALV